MLCFVVFTSTVNIRFNGRELLDAKEEEEEEDVDDPEGEFSFDYIDEYSKTKHKAERLVLRGSQDMKTCSLRLGGVYGPGERCLLPRSARFIRSGLMDVAYCLPDDLKIDFLHVDNAVQVPFS